MLKLFVDFYVYMLKFVVSFSCLVILVSGRFRDCSNQFKLVLFLLV